MSASGRSKSIEPRASRRALELGLEGARDAGCRFSNLERWSRFFRARAAVQLTDRRQVDGGDLLTLLSADGVSELTLLLAGSATEASLADSGARLPVHELILEGRPQRAVTLDLPAGVPVTLRLAPAA